MRKERNKLKPEEINKIRARFVMKFEEFDKIPSQDELNEDGTVKVRGLRTRFREDKMSGTDKRALVAVVDRRMNEQMKAIQDMQKVQEQADELNKEIGGEHAESEPESMPTEE